MPVTERPGPDKQVGVPALDDRSILITAIRGRTTPAIPNQPPFTHRHPSRSEGVVSARSLARPFGMHHRSPRSTGTLHHEIEGSKGTAGPPPELLTRYGPGSNQDQPTGGRAVHLCPDCSAIRASSRSRMHVADSPTDSPSPFLRACARRISRGIVLWVRAWMNVRLTPRRVPIRRLAQ